MTLAALQSRDVLDLKLSTEGELVCAVVALPGSSAASVGFDKQGLHVGGTVGLRMAR